MRRPPAPDDSADGWTAVPEEQPQPGDEKLVQRAAENVDWQHFCGMEYVASWLPSDATQIGRFRLATGDEGLELLLKATIETAVHSKTIKAQELERVIAGSTVQENAIAHPSDSRLLEIAYHKLIGAVRWLGLKLKQTFARKGQELRWRAGVVPTPSNSGA